MAKKYTLRTDSTVIFVNFFSIRFFVKLGISLSQSSWARKLISRCTIHVFTRVAQDEKIHFGVLKWRDFG